MVAVVFARNWALSWWEWHLLLTGAFGLVAASLTMRAAPRAPAWQCKLRRSRAAGDVPSGLPRRCMTTDEIAGTTRSQQEKSMARGLLLES